MGRGLKRDFRHMKHFYIGVLFYLIFAIYIDKKVKLVYSKFIRDVRNIKILIKELLWLLKRGIKPILIPSIS